MASQGKRPYAVDKHHQNNLEQNVNGHKKVHDITYTVATTPKRLQDGFSSKLSTEKKSVPVPSLLHATRSTMAMTDSSKIASSNRSVYDSMTPFTPGKKKGRKKKTTMQSATKRPASAATNNNQSNTTTSATLPPNQSTAPNAPTTPLTASRHIGSVELEERDDDAHLFHYHPAATKDPTDCYQMKSWNCRPTMT